MFTLWNMGAIVAKYSWATWLWTRWHKTKTCRHELLFYTNRRETTSPFCSSNHSLIIHAQKQEQQLSDSALCSSRVKSFSCAFKEQEVNPAFKHVRTLRDVFFQPSVRLARASQDSWLKEENKSGGRQDRVWGRKNYRGQIQLGERESEQARERCSSHYIKEGVM